MIFQGGNPPLLNLKLDQYTEIIKKITNETIRLYLTHSWPHGII